MPKIKLTKGELKRRRDALKQYERYLPTLQLKKQQLQTEILNQLHILDEKKKLEELKKKEIMQWASILGDSGTDIRPWIKPKNIAKSSKSVAGVDVPVFEKAEFDAAEYDLFLTPLWVDQALVLLRILVSIEEEIIVVEEGAAVLRNELRITTQRVNLFEKVKIPEAREAIRRIKIYLGDQMANAVGRSKIAKRKIEEMVPEEIAP